MNLNIPLLVFFLFPNVQARDPFESLIRKKCLKGRRVTGCNQTLIEAYKNTELSKDDDNINKAETYVMLITNKNTDNPEYLDECGGKLPENTLFNKKWSLEIIIHGFLEGVCQVAWMREMAIQLHYRGNYNIVLIDYSWGNQLDYYDAVRNAPVVCRQVAFVIRNIMKETGFKASEIHIIGHSLGAQVAGCIGYYVKNMTHQLIGRITGLDPAGPGYMATSATAMQSLDKSDAAFVDAIHTNAGSCMPFALGHPGPLAHLDFYPNGGSVQNSCILNIVPSLLKGDLDYGIGSLLLPACFHKQSVQYFKISINSCECQFLGVAAESYSHYKTGKKSCGTDGSKCAVMGMDAPYFPYKEGSYYLDTDNKCPYCNNKDIKRQGFPSSPTGKEKPKCFSKKTSILPVIG